MKYFIAVLLSIFIWNFAVAQDFKKVQASFLLGRIEEAKGEVEKLLADTKAKEKPETWYWKARVDAAMYKNEALRIKYPNILVEANTSFKKYIELDPLYAIVKEKGAEGFFDMYATSFGKGVDGFKEKNWLDATRYFQSAVYYSDYIFKNKWSASTAIFDTTSILYCGYSFQNAQKMDEAAVYYTRLADAKVKGEGFVDIYKFLLDYYTKSKNKTEFEKYLALGYEVYPAEKWEEYEIEYIDVNLDIAQKTAIYDERNAKGTLTENMYLLFGDVFVNAKHKAGVDSSLHDSYTKKAIESYKKAHEKNAQNVLAVYNIGIIYYNYYTLEDDKYLDNIKKLQQINTNLPVIKDIKKKAAADAEHKLKVDGIKSANKIMEKTAMENADMSIEWLTKSYLILKDKSSRTNTEKGILNKSIDFITNLYYYKMSKVRGKDPKSFDAFELKYKEFDALHGSFK